VTGVDLTAGFIRKGRLLAKARNLPVRFACADMREIEYDREFDAVVNWFTSIGYLDDAGELTAVQRAYEALKPGGRFLIEAMNKSFILSHFRTHLDETVAGVRIVHNPRYNARTGRINETWVMSKGKKTERHPISIRLYNGTEIRALLRKAGFRDIQLFGHPPLGRFTRHSRRFIAIGRRPVR